MLQSRVIPVLLLRASGLVKGVKFKDHKYVGDAINAVRIFNEKEVDELVFLDIDATYQKRGPDMKMLADIASECFMPLCYGGGVRNIQQVRDLFTLGVEKVAFNTSAVEDPDLIKSAANEFGSQSIIVSLDVKKTLLGKHEVYVRSGTQNTKRDPVAVAQMMEKAGAGELLLNSIDRDGTMQGYDIDLIKRVAQSVAIPVVACGGAGKVADLKQALDEAGASAAAAGSFFVFYGKHRAVLINYPPRAELEAFLT